MRRRALLSTLGVGLLGGCVADGPGGSDGGSTTDRTTAPTTDEPTADDSTTTTTPRTPDVGVPASETAGPPWGDDVMRVVAWPDVTDGTPIAMRPATQEASLPTAMVDITLANETDVRFDTNFHHWGLWKRVDGEWFYLAPQYWPEPAMSLDTGESHTWTLSVDNTQLDGNVIQNGGSKDDISLVGLGGGTYAFTTHGNFATEDYEHAHGFAARVDLAGEPVELVPTSDVTATIRDGDAIVVEVDRGDDGGSEEVAYTVRRLADDAVVDAEPRRIVTEQALRSRVLRDTLSFFEEGVERVHLRGLETHLNPFGFDAEEPQVLAYAGRRYRITSETA
ncbi:hypothetical protein SAMN04487949_2687 [Halogranum gelatinilyticum]|uniref:Uncharacterized protein n=1 Tax=Halogranum gelatinilyticum TaxID=660521 RepID=A0A1G9WB35_9EURY|nr:hypothetical protein [Halogranum gelatinilyticum]SDM81712.1 hypothetical protein SAMN04487949_2687 [Halogranum gelatinilyticum]